MTTEAGRVEWLAERKTLIGASETPSILGKGYETPAEVWARKVGLADGTEETERMEIGNVVQPAIVELARRRIGLDFQHEPANRVRRSNIEYIGASLDAFVTEDGLDIPLDAKNVDRIHGREWEESPPIGYQIQLQQQMFVTGADHGYLFALIGGNRTAWHRVDRNEAFIAAMLKKLEWFWGLVQTRTPPPYQDPQDQARVLATLYPKSNGTAVVLDEVAAKIIERRNALDAIYTETEARLTECDNELKALLGENSFGALPDGRWISWKQQTVKEHVRKASTFRVLRFHDKRPKDAPALEQPETHEPIEITGGDCRLGCDEFYQRSFEAQAAMLGIGGIIRHESDSGSAYFVLPGGLNVRISDHEPNGKTSEWIERNAVVSVRVDQEDWRDQLSAIVGTKLELVTTTETGE